MQIKETCSSHRHICVSSDPNMDGEESWSIFMEVIHRVRQLLLKNKMASSYRRWLRIIGTSALTLVLSLNILSGERLFVPIHKPNAQAATTFTFITDADSYVKQSYPNSNYGNSSSLQVNGVSNPDQESFIRFTVTGISGTVQSAQLRVYATTNGTKNGPAVYATDTSWTETGITWNNRPDRTSGAVDNKANISTSSWAEYNVTALVTGEGTFSFVLAADSSDGVRFSSRQGSHPPELILTLASAETTPTPT